MLAQLRSLVPGSGKAGIGLINNRFSHTQDVAPCKIRRAHGDSFGGRGHIRCFVDMGRRGAAEDSKNPGGSGLGAGY